MFFMMVGWHVWGKAEPVGRDVTGNDAREFAARRRRWSTSTPVRTETDQKIPGGAPPSGGGRLPDRPPAGAGGRIIELEKDKTYACT